MVLDDHCMGSERVSIVRLGKLRNIRIDENRQRKLVNEVLELVCYLELHTTHTTNRRYVILLRAQKYFRRHC